MTAQAQDTSVRTEIVVEAPVERTFQVFPGSFDRIKPRAHHRLTGGSSALQEKLISSAQKATRSMPAL